MSTLDAMSTPTADEVEQIRARHQRRIEQLLGVVEKLSARMLAIEEWLEQYRLRLDASGHGVFTQYGYLDEEGNECWATNPFDHLAATSSQVMIMRQWTHGKAIPVTCLES